MSEKIRHSISGCTWVVQAAYPLSRARRELPTNDYEALTLDQSVSPQLPPP